MDKVQCHAFFLSQDAKQNVLLSSYLDSWWRTNFKIYLGSASKAMVDREKNEYLANGKSFLNKIKNIFDSFWRAIVWCKIKNLIKISGHKL